MSMYETHRGVLPVLVALLVTVLASPGPAAVRVMGSIGVEAYGYKDALDEEHVWLHQRTRLAVVQVNGPLSFRFSGGYLGDNSDDFGDSARFRFLEGNVQYGGLASRLTGRVGRFFRYRGVTLGVVDGAEISWSPRDQWQLTAFGGVAGPRNRKFELVEDPDQSLSVGGELRWSPGRFPLFRSTSILLSYTRQDRNEGTIRQLLGLATYHRIGSGTTWFNTLHVRPTDSPLRKFITRLRLHARGWNAVAEVGVLKPNAADISWFSDFADLGTSGRVRLGVDRHVVRRRWAVGAEAAMLESGGKSGLRGGPVLTTPWGQAGYRFAGGDHALGSGPWLSLRATPAVGLELYARGAMVSYEWDALDVEEEDLTTLQAGMRYRPGFLNGVLLHGEIQVYETPQFEEDRRVVGGVTWRFDSRGGRR